MSLKKVLSIGLASLILGSSLVTYGVELPEREISSVSYEEDIILIGQGLESSETIATQVVASSESELKELIRENMVSRANSFAIKFDANLGINEVSSLIEKIYGEIISEDEYLYGHLKSFGRRVSGWSGNWDIELNLTYASTRAQEEFVDSEVERIYSEIISPGMSDFEKVKAINDYIVLNTEYSTALPSGVSPHGAYAVLKEGKGVCSGYALAALRLLERAGIEARYITGYAGEPHGWNLLKLDGKWYHMDTTWNDPMPDRRGLVSYEHFLTTDAQMRKTHSWQASDYPAATSSQYSWMHRMTSAITAGDTIYYANQDDDISLYSIGIDGSGNRRITPQRAPYFAVAGDSIYFSNYSMGGYLYRIGIDGSGMERVNDRHTVDIYLEGNRVYYREQDTGVQRYIEVEIEVEEPILVERIDLDRESLSLELGGKTRLSATVYPLDAENSGLTWRTADSSIASVDANGNIEAVSAGETSVIVSTEDGSVSKSISVSVNDTYQGYHAWADKLGVDKNKDWTVQFNQSLDESTVNSDNVYVIDGLGNRVSGLELDVLEGGRSLNLRPTESYVPGVYYLTVENIQSESGSRLMENTRMKFKI